MIVQIAFDGMGWGGQETGVARAGRLLFCSLAASGVRGHLAAYVPRDLADDLLPPPASGVSIVRLPRRTPLLRILWQQSRLPSRLRRDGVDLLVSPSYTAPLRTSVMTSLIVHDVIAFEHPSLCRPRNRLHLRTLVPPSIRRATVIFTPTEVVRRQVIDRFSVDPQRVVTLPWGVDASFGELSVEEARHEVYERHGIRPPYLLFLGTLERKKNLDAVLRAAEDSRLPLVVAGPPAWENLPARSLMESRGHIHVGYRADAEIRSLLRAADVLLMLSHSEGFGMPVLEALAAGVPVVASMDAALREVSGGHACHVEGDDRTAVAGAIHRLRTDPCLRQRLVREGQEYTRRRTWARSVARFLSTVDSVMGRSPGQQVGS